MSRIVFITSVALNLRQNKKSNTFSVLTFNPENMSCLAHWFSERYSVIGQTNFVFSAFLSTSSCVAGGIYEVKHVTNVFQPCRLLTDRLFVISFCWFYLVSLLYCYCFLCEFYLLNWCNMLSQLNKSERERERQNRQNDDEKEKSLT